MPLLKLGQLAVSNEYVNYKNSIKGMNHHLFLHFKQDIVIICYIHEDVTQKIIFSNSYAQH